MQEVDWVCTLQNLTRRFERSRTPRRVMTPTRWISRHDENTITLITETRPPATAVPASQPSTNLPSAPARARQLLCRALGCPSITNSAQ